MPVSYVFLAGPTTDCYCSSIAVIELSISGLSVSFPLIRLVSAMLSR